MYDLISVGSITIDLFYKGTSLTQDKDRFNLAIGGKYVVDSFYESLGGGGANVGAGVATHNLSCAVLGKVGTNQFKQIIIQKLLKKCISIEFLQYDTSYTNISSILLSENGERTIINYQTPNENFNLATNTLKKLENTKSVYFGNLPDISIGERISIIKNFKKNNSIIFLNLGSKDCKRPIEEIQELISLSDFLLINTFEFSEIVKKPKKEIDFNSNVLKLLNFYKGKIVLTDGENGAYYYDKNTNLYFPAVKVPKAIDTTGAGDAFCAGFIASNLKDNNNITLSMESGLKFAAQIVQQIGAQ